jgi:hypothetical protein
MKTSIWVCLLALLMVSCEKEKEIIKIEKEIPDTIKLIEVELSGQINDLDNNGLEDVDILFTYEDYLLGQTKSDAMGQFNTSKLGLHDSKTVVTFRKEGYSPNILTSQLNNNEKSNVVASLKKLLVSATYEGSSQSVKLNNNINVNLSADMVETAKMANIKMQHFDFKKDPATVMLATKSTDGEVIFSEVIWLEFENEANEVLQWKANKTAEIAFSNLQSNPSNLWYFDYKQARWVKDVSLIINKNTVSATINKSGFYAILSDCNNDIEKPKPYCLNDISVVFVDMGETTIHARDFDKGSYDNCDLNLDFTIRSLTDKCSNGSNIFAPSIKLCKEDVNSTIELVVKVSDDNNNSDSCIVSLSIVGNTSSGCTGDDVKPTPYCVNQLSVSIFGTNEVVLFGFDLNKASYDNCTASPNLRYLVEKIEPDACNNGINKLEETVTFCSAEVNKDILVKLHVYDEAGNHDFCSAIVTVQ